jgi:hypothetical protein
LALFWLSASAVGGNFALFVPLIPANQPLVFLP